MESPFFGNTWYDYTPRSHYRSPIMREVPIQTPNCDPYYSLRNRQVPRHPKVVPVQFAAQERRRSDLSSDAALNIQKAFRGHLVRKSVNKIARIKRDVDEISKQVTKKETAELVRTDAKERLKVVETLMNLLLKLDSVKCIDSGVRELRKAVVKKAIALQERVEASAANHQSGETGVNNQRESFGNSSESKKKDELLARARR